ncbi:hypothetical protein QF037_003316 [Streptomyces canus]|uniref:hypothetical protein n=1 Tax=Streptomyces canus TaxID=58343 RepID=UPI00277E7096|nr:hypothetical protein [Streptomyces canus]MDQ0598971.1 hypothetical protein [Streptomyces canus]
MSVTGATRTPIHRYFSRTVRQPGPFHGGRPQQPVRALTVLTNHSLLPLAERPDLYVQGVSGKTAAAYGNVVADPAEADVAVLRLRTPFEPRTGAFESYFHAGSLAFPEDELKEILRLLGTVPTLVCVNLERPAVLPEIAERAAALVADFGASDAALLDVAFGRARAEGRLPFELPRSMAAVAAARPDVPDDTGPGVPVRPRTGPVEHP